MGDEQFSNPRYVRQKRTGHEEFTICLYLSNALAIQSWRIHIGSVYEPLKQITASKHEDRMKDDYW